MAKVYVERAYIEPFDEDDQESYAILVHIKDIEADGSINHIYAGKIELTHNVAWIHMNTADNGDLDINYSAGMEANKWDHITKEIIGG